MAWGFVDGGAGRLDPRTYENELGSTTAITWLVVFTDDNDFLRLSARNPEGLAGLWLKVADHLAVEIDAATRMSTTGIVREWDIPEGSLDWSDEVELEVSLWDKRPPLAPAPPRKLWTSTLGAASGGYGNLGSGVGYGRNRAGTLAPDSYLEPRCRAGNAAVFNRIVELADDRVYVAVSLDEQVSCLEGHWLKLADHLAFELTAPTHESGDRWFFDIPEGSFLGWTAGTDYEISLWDKQPPLAPVPARQLWSTTMTVGFEQYQNEGSGYGYGEGGHGSLTDATYEYEPGSEATLRTLVLFRSDTLRMILDNSSTLNGLWLRVSDSLALQLGAASGNTREWSIGVNSLSWPIGAQVEISLWDKDPTSG